LRQRRKRSRPIYRVIRRAKQKEIREVVFQIAIEIALGLRLVRAEARKIRV
jgi:hypothetical protein